MAEWTTEERADLGQQLRALLASGGAPGVTAAFRYRHGWKLISGDRKAAEQAAADAETASKHAVGEMTHSTAANAHHKAARAFEKIGDHERAAHHTALAKQHSAEGMRHAYSNYTEDYPDLTKPKYDAAFGRPLRSNQYDDDMSGHSQTLAKTARSEEGRREDEARAKHSRDMLKHLYGRRDDDESAWAPWM